jgi:hypothetical protein
MARNPEANLGRVHTYLLAQRITLDMGFSISFFQKIPACQLSVGMLDLEP